MSMLAERRRKTKWSIIPRMKPLWTTDPNSIKFGKELMEKMGWSAGKGLGAKEQGIPEPLRVSYKNDTKGMGFKGNDDEWIEQQDEFNVLLSKLRNSDDSCAVKGSEEKNEIKSLEEKSRLSRARVHYQKFTRGKDLSRYSENDLACILGTNRIKEKSKTEVVESEEKTDGLVKTSFGVTTIQGGSMEDYFKRKWIINKDQSKSVPDVDEEKELSCDERPSFSRVFGESLNSESKEFSKKEQDGCEMDVDSGEKYEKKKKKKKKDEQTSEEEEEPKSKRKKMTSDQDNPVDEELQNALPGVASNETETENLLGNEKDCDSSRKRKKEKRKSKKDEENEAIEEADMVEVKKKKKKEKKEKPVENGYCDTEGASIECNLEAEHQGELVIKKKKGKNGNEDFGESKKENVEEPSLEGSVGEMNDAVEGKDGVVAKGKKKKEKHSESVGAEEPSGKNKELGKVSHVCEGETVEVGSKKKKRKKEEEKECCSNENGISNEIPEKGERNCDNIMELEQSSKKKKKREDKTECCGNENEIPEEKHDSGNNSNVNTELEVKEKKKKKKKEKQEEKMECDTNENGLCNEIPKEKHDSGNNSNGTTELEDIKEKKKKKKKEKQDRVECYANESGITSEVPVEKCDRGNNCNSNTELEVKEKKKKEKKQKQEDKMECSNENGPSTNEKCDGESNSNNTVELDEVKKKKKKKDKQEKKEDKMECCPNENELSSDVPKEKCDRGSNFNATNELEVKEKNKKKKKEKKEDKMECCTNENGLSSEIAEEKCDSGGNSNWTTELEVKKKDKKKKKEGKMECCTNQNGLSSEIAEEKCDGESNSSNTVELDRVKKKKKKKDKQDKKEDKTECCTTENGHFSDIPEEKCDNGSNNSNSNPELEQIKKKKKKDKHKTKEEDSGSNNIKESRLEETSQAAINDPSETETVQKKKKKKDKKEKQKSKDESSVDHQEQESKESSPVHQSTNAEVGSATNGSEGVKGDERKWGGLGNAEIGTSVGIDRVEQISQRAAYEHVAGQHKYERIKNMFQCIHLTRFRGSNLECLNGYGVDVRKCQTSAS